MKCPVVVCCGALAINAYLQSARADDIGSEPSEHEVVEQLPEAGETRVISFPSLSGDDILMMEFVVTEDMLANSWSLNDVFVAAKLEARSGKLAVKSGNKPFEDSVPAPQHDDVSAEDDDCD